MSITNLSRRNALVFGAVLVSCAPLFGCTADSPHHPALGTYASNLVQDNDFSGTILLARGSRIEFESAYGLADRRTQRPNTTGTKFSLASVSKMFTAVCILQLVDAGIISLEDPVGKHLPEYPNRAARENVRIKHLLMHTSGIGNYWERLGKLDGARPDSHIDYLPLFADIPLEHEPGSAFSYSNGGYIVLGLIIEAVTGRSYYDHVQRAVFDRAGMRDSGFHRLDENIPDRAIGYMRSVEHPGKWDDATERWEQRGSAAGGGYSTAGDLHRFALALQDHRLLSPEMTSAFLRGRLDTPVGKYGYGMIAQSLNGMRVLGHSGGHYGVAAELMMVPETDTTFVVLSNGDVDGYWDVEMFAHELIAGPTDETRAHAFTKELIAATVSGGFDAGLNLFRSNRTAGDPKEGVMDLAAFRYIHRGEDEAGLGLLRLNRAIHPESDDAIFSLAQGLRVTGRKPEALRLYREYLDRVPDSTEAQAQVERLAS